MLTRTGLISRRVQVLPGRMTLTEHSLVGGGVVVVARCAEHCTSHLPMCACCVCEQAFFSLLVCPFLTLILLISSLPSADSADLHPPREYLNDRTIWLLPSLRYVPLLSLSLAFILLLLSLPPHHHPVGNIPCQSYHSDDQIV